ncbi:hypothetical protein HRED_01786 [Candidatus Haloredivivus sp. G17]|jgi:hypothetical protein|nr:hypothetical protein HRED_01786 [Candidatus Haloredivivus sp. G17]
MMSRDKVIEDASEDAEIIIEALEQVRDPEIEASEYDFLDELEKIHPAPSKRKGNDGLANWIAHLAVFEVDDKVLVDEGLVEEADRILAEQHGNPRYGRSRIANIVYDSGNRPGGKSSLAERRFNGDEANGHDLLAEMVADFYIETGQEEKLENLYKDSGLLLACDNMTEGGMSTSEFKESDHEPVDRRPYDGESFPPGVMVYEPTDNQNPESNQGGDNDMGLVEDMSEYAQDRMDDGMDATDAYEDAIDHYSDDLNEADAKLQSVETALRQELLAVSIKGGEMQRVIGHLEGKIDAREDDREDTMDSIRASYNNITDR